MFLVLERGLASAALLPSDSQALTPVNVEGSSRPVGINDGEFLSMFLAHNDLAQHMKRKQDDRRTGPDADDREFPRYHGVHAGFAVWVDEHPEVAVWRLVDARLVFPSVVLADGFLKAAMKKQAEGQPPIHTSHLVGEGCQVFGGTVPNPVFPAMTLTHYYYIFRVENVVVKVYVAQGPRVPSNIQLRPEHVAAIAGKIEMKIKALSRRQH